MLHFEKNQSHGIINLKYILANFSFLATQHNNFIIILFYSQAMANCMKTILGDNLHVRDQDHPGLKQLPSPNDLRFKILVKVMFSFVFSGRKFICIYVY